MREHFHYYGTSGDILWLLAKDMFCLHMQMGAEWLKILKALVIWIIHPIPIAQKTLNLSSFRH